MIRSLRRRRDQRGLSLVEVMVTMVIMTTIVGIVGPLLVSSMASTNRVEFQSRAVDELRQAVNQIGRELRSAECITDPVVPANATSATSTSLSFRTDANNTTYDVTYSVGNGKLTRVVGTTTQTVSNYLVSGSFTHVATPRRSVSMTFTVQVDSRQQPDNITTTIAGRNAWRSVC